MACISEIKYEIKYNKNKKSCVYFASCLIKQGMQTLNKEYFLIVGKISVDSPVSIYVVIHLAFIYNTKHKYQIKIKNL